MCNSITTTQFPEKWLIRYSKPNEIDNQYKKNKSKVCLRIDYLFRVICLTNDLRKTLVKSFLDSCEKCSMFSTSILSDIEKHDVMTGLFELACRSNKPNVGNTIIKAGYKQTRRDLEFSNLNPLDCFKRYPLYCDLRKIFLRACQRQDIKDEELIHTCLKRNPNLFFEYDEETNKKGGIQTPVFLKYSLEYLPKKFDMPSNYNPLHVIAKAGRRDLIPLFHNAFSYSQKDENGKIPLDYALEQGRDGVQVFFQPTDKEAYTEFTILLMIKKEMFNEVASYFLKKDKLPTEILLPTIKAGDKNFFKFICSKLTLETFKESLNRIIEMIIECNQSQLFEHLFEIVGSPEESKQLEMMEYAILRGNSSTVRFLAESFTESLMKMNFPFPQKYIEKAVLFIKTNDWESLDDFLKRKAVKPQSRTQEGKTLFEQACLVEHVNCLDVMLNDNPTMMFGRLTHGWTLLHTMNQSQEKIVKKYFEKNTLEARHIYLKASENFPITPLKSAFQRKCLDSIKYLLAQEIRCTFSLSQALAAHLDHFVVTYLTGAQQSTEIPQEVQEEALKMVESLLIQYMKEDSMILDGAIASNMGGVVLLYLTNTNQSWLEAFQSWPEALKKYLPTIDLYKVHPNIRERALQKIGDHLMVYVTDLTYFFNHQIACDFTITSTKIEPSFDFHVNKTILMNRWAFFKDKNPDRQLDLKISKESLKLLLEYIYSGNKSITLSNFPKLASLCKKYGLSLDPLRSSLDGKPKEYQPLGYFLATDRMNIGYLI